MASNLDVVYSHDTPQYGIGRLYEHLHMVAWVDHFHCSAYAGDWLREMEKIKNYENMKIVQVINIACGILSDVHEMDRITTISFVDRLKKKFSDIEENRTVELGPYSWEDIESIRRILFYSFSVCCNRMGDDEFDSEFRRLVDEYDTYIKRMNRY